MIEYFKRISTTPRIITLTIKISFIAIIAKIINIPYVYLITTIMSWIIKNL